MRTNGKAGFTLLEVVVVLAVLAILSCLLLSVFFGRARENARRASCQSNEKQIALGFRQYIQDYNEKFPPPGPNRTNCILGNRAGWADSLQSYLKDSCIFQCPSETNPYLSAYPEQVDYGYNASLGGVSEDSIHHSANVVLEFEGNQNAADALTASAGNTSQVYVGRHEDGSNYAFLDGHAKWLLSDNAPSDCYPPGAVPGSSYVFCLK